jgi:amidase/aspartyl-tRNA(Asn)/glutamyl-tRNA(Gln) amidotransferase subunit A
MPTLTADAASASVLALGDWQELAARDPEAAARELARRLETSLSPEQQRACFADRADLAALTDGFRRAVALPRAVAPLAGVPYTLKDLYYVAGKPVRAGSRFPSGLAPVRGQSGRLPRMLEGAGAVLAARTHLYEFAYGLTGENETHGDCEHPHFPGRTTGGSSSGAAASVAAGIVPFAVGTDTGGSVRVPAAFCGLFGMRLTPGDEWITDAFPLAPGFDTAGWFTQNAADMESVNRAILGPGGPSVTAQTEREPARAGCVAAQAGCESVQTGRVSARTERVSARAERVSARAERVTARAGRELRGCFVDFATMGFSIKMPRAFSRALREAGGMLAPPPDQLTREEIARAFHGALQSYVVLQSTEAYRVHREWLDRYREYYSKGVWERLDRGRRRTDGQLEAARIKQRAVRVFWEHFFRGHDFLVMPVAPFPALAKAECTQANRERLLALMAPASLGGLPVLTVPVRLPSGLSAGLQVIVRDAHSPVISDVLRRMA